MPLFAIHALDKPDLASLRRDTQGDHLAYLKALGSAVFAAGPLIGLDGGPIGSLLLVDVPDRRAAYQIAADDPYSLTGLFATVSITQWNKSLPV